MFFNPQIVDQRFTQSVDTLVDKVIQLCPIDTRRKLYSNIALSGGSTLFKGFKERLEVGILKKVNDRLFKYESISKQKSTPIKVSVLNNPYQRYAVWLGGSMLAGSPGFQSMYHTREEYFERGSQICRYNAVFMA